MAITVVVLLAGLVNLLPASPGWPGGRTRFLPSSPLALPASRTSEPVFGVEVLPPEVPPSRDVGIQRNEADVQHRALEVARLTSWLQRWLPD